MHSKGSYTPVSDVVLWSGTSVTKSHLKKLKSFKKAFQFFQNGYESSYQDLLEKSNKSAMTIQRLRTLCLEAFKSFNHLNPSFRSNISELKTSGTPNRSQQNLNLTHFIPVSHFYAH